MQPLFPTVVIRHRKENLKKCSLKGLETRPDFLFYRYPLKVIPNISNYILLTLDAPLLSSEDANRGLLVLDGTWRYASQMKKQLEPHLGSVILRSLPSSCRTAYPRRQEDCPDPELGLASVEAIYVAYKLLGWNTEGLLDNYHWKEQFLEKIKGP